MIRGGLFRRAPRTAAEWFALRRELRTPRLERHFERWLGADPANAEEYALCEIAWEVSRPAAQQLAPGLAIVSRHAAGRRWAIGAAAVVASAVLVAAGLTWFRPAQTQVLSTAVGELRTVVLDDGSRLSLNTRTLVEVRLTRRTREVTLERGEAFFVVAKDAARPFIVRTRFGSAQALGTRFNVYLTEGRLALTTEEGRVLLASTRTGSSVVVTAGRRAELAAGSGTPRVSAANLATTLDWMNQRLEVDDVPLGAVLEDFSRYTRLPVRAASADIAAMRVTAVLRTGDIEALEATLRGAFGLTLERRGEEYLVIRLSAPAVGPAPGA
jgi:transmembrane sensor